MKRKENLQNGITLISLVITIVVLLILATVAISMAVDSNGLFARARKAAEDWNKSVGDESTAIENAMLIMNEISGGSTSGGGTEPPPVEEKDTEPPTGSHTLSSEIVKKGEKATLTVTGEDNVGVKQIKKPDGTIQEGKTATYEIETTGEYKFEIEDEAGNKTPYTAKVRIAILPEGYVASSVASESTIENGLVIYEGEGEVNDSNHTTAMGNRNQYVWIPVDDINSMVMCQKCGANGKLIFNTETNKLQCSICNAITKFAGKLYAIIEGRSIDVELKEQTYNADSGLREPGNLSATDWGDASTNAITAIKGILEDEYPDKKGKYEDTYDSIKTDWLELQQTDFDNMAKSVAKYKGFYISRYEIQAGGASKKGQDVMTGADNSQMWYGLFKALRRTNSNITSQMIWGSQYDQVMMFVNDDKYNVQLPVESLHNLSGYKKSGENDNDIAHNIHDLEGNYYEWTSETTGNSNHVDRGRQFRP